MPVPPAITAYGTTPAPDNTPSPQPLNVLDTLYLAALGPTGAVHYMPLFARFDILGRTRTHWNHAAAFFSIAWLLYRKLWSVALAYVVLMEGIAIAWLVGIRPSLSLPLPVETGLALTWLTISVALPGLWGDAMVYNDVHKRTMRSLESAATLAQARSELEREAPTRLRLYALAGLQALVMLVTLAALLWPGSPLELASPTIEPTPASTATDPLPTADEVLARMTTASPTAKVEVLATPPSSEASAPAVPASAPAEAASAPALDAAPAPTAATVVVLPASVMAPTAAMAPASKPAPVATQRAPRTSPPKTEPSERSVAKSVARAKPASSASASVVAPAAEISKTLESKRYYVNVGVFADEANAQKVQQQLQKAKLPLMVQTVSTNKGDRIRVRTGPFATASKARAAARKAQQLGLEAVVFQHP